MIRMMTGASGRLWTRGLNETFGVTADLVQIRGSAVREIAESAFTGIKPSDEREALAIDGQESDPRMLAQMSKFTIHSEPHTIGTSTDERRLAASVCDPKSRQSQNSQTAFSLWHPTLKPIP